MSTTAPSPEQVLVYINSYRQREGVPPSLTAIATAFGTDVATARACIDALIARGLLRRFGEHAAGMKDDP